MVGKFALRRCATRAGGPAAPSRQRRAPAQRVVVEAPEAVEPQHAVLAERGAAARRPRHRGPRGAAPGAARRKRRGEPRPGRGRSRRGRERRRGGGPARASGPRPGNEASQADELLYMIDCFLAHGRMCFFQ